jgi:predicted nucleic acid-binding protein
MKFSDLAANIENRKMGRGNDPLVRNRVRIGTMDLKIASIALANDATVLTCNARDFSKVPNLRIEDWLA